MTNDVLEQVAEDYFRSEGYFTQHNIKYRPGKKGVHSDIDVLAVHPTEKGISSVIVASCKSWQGGLKIKGCVSVLTRNPHKIIGGKQHWKTFRELARKKWSTALRNKVRELTGKDTFTFYLVVTKYKGDQDSWEKCVLFSKNLPGCCIKLIDMKTMLLKLYDDLDTTPAHSELSRLLQLIKADKGQIRY